MSLEAIAQAQLDAYNAQDLDAHCAHFADDVVVAGLNGEVARTGLHERTFMVQPDKVAVFCGGAVLHINGNACIQLLLHGAQRSFAVSFVDGQRKILSKSLREFFRPIAEHVEKIWADKLESAMQAGELDDPPGNA